MKHSLRVLWLLLALVPAACAPPTAELETAATPPPAATEPPATATLAEQAAPVDLPDEAGPVVYGRLDAGAYFHGAPDAPVTLIDYSDFL
jgi:hypothetical protein